MYTDKQLTCVDCGADFTFSSGEQERYAQLGFTNEPKRCAPCRAAKKAAGGGRPAGERKSFPAGGAFGSSAFIACRIPASALCRTGAARAMRGAVCRGPL